MLRLVWITNDFVSKYLVQLPGERQLEDFVQQEIKNCKDVCLQELHTRCLRLLYPVYMKHLKKIYYEISNLSE